MVTVVFTGAGVFGWVFWTVACVVAAEPETSGFMVKHPAIIISILTIRRQDRNIILISGLPCIFQNEL